jgi:magnesium-transporting ATPase (P-type)
MKCINVEEAKRLDYKEICKTLETDPSDGLNKNEANTRLRVFGYNEFDVKQDSTLVGKYVEQVKF